MAAATKTAARLAPYVEQLIEDDSARKELRKGATKLRDAYGRSRKGRVKATSDRKLRRQLIAAASALGTGARSTVKGAQEPERHWGRRLLGLLGLGAVAAGVALALNEDLRDKLFGSGEESPVEPINDGIGP